MIHSPPPAASRGPFFPRRRFSLPHGTQVALPAHALGAVSFAFIIGLHLLGAGPSLVIGLLFLWALFIGVSAIARTSRRLGDPRINRLCWLHIIKLCGVLYLVFVAWIPFLERGSQYYGYDPQRYYFDAVDLSRTIFSDPLVLPGAVLKNPGILYYYGAIFLVLPSHPLVPAIANTLVTLGATLLLLRLGYLLDTPHRRTRWTLGLYMVSPDVIWYDCLTSRETVVGACCVAVVASLYMLFGREKRCSQRRSLYLPMLVVSTSALAVLRTAALIPVALAVVAKTIVVPFRRARLGLGLTVTIVTCCLLYFAPVLNQGLGAVAYDDAGSLFAYGEGNVQWQDKSVGRLVTPQSAWVRLGVAPLRLLAYLGGPVRSFWELAPPHYWLSYQYIAEAAASAIYIMLFPLVLVSLPLRDRARSRDYAWLVFPFWGFILALGVGTAQIHARYRVMAIPFLCACAWLGRGAAKKARVRAAIIWGTTLVCGSVAYGVYKAFT
jgi:hypothetical protein